MIMLLIGVVHTLFFVCVFGIHIAYSLKMKEIDKRCVLCTKMLQWREMSMG